MAKRKSKKRSPARAAKAKRTSARKTKRSAKSPVRKAGKTKKAKKAKRSAAARAPKRRAAKTGRREVTGEGNYTAAREFRKSEESFVRANRSRIPEMGKEAERALEGPEGAGLARAEEDARSHARE